jgi:hypothetical protein
MAEVFEFPVRAPAELELVERLKEATFAFSGRLTVAQVIGCFDIAISEIKDSQ